MGWECAYVCQDLRTKKEGIYIKKWEYQSSNWCTKDLYPWNQASKVYFLAKYYHFLAANVKPFLRWEYEYVWHEVRNKKGGVYSNVSSIL